MLRSLLLLTLLTSVCGAEVNLNAFGGDPLVQAEIGAVPSDDDVASDLPPLKICQEEGIEPTECSQECLFGCTSPMCSMSCLCACDSAQQRSKLVTILRQEQKEMRLLSVQHDMWKAGQIGLVQKNLEPGSVPHDNQLHTADSVIDVRIHEPTSNMDNARHGNDDERMAQQIRGIDIEQDTGTSTASPKPTETGTILDSRRNPRFQRHQKSEKKRRFMKALAYNAFMKQAAIKSRAQEQRRSDEAMTDVGGFDWNKMSQKPTIRKDPAMVALGRESDKIDDVYDPTEDPQNIGPGDSQKKDGKKMEWWSEDTLKGAQLNDQWWQHGGEEGMTG